jgi:hypothetical protein
MRTRILVSFVVLAAFVIGSGASAQTASERVETIKAILDASKQALHEYQWIETETISLNGEQKAQKVSRCYYGPDGKVQKMVISQTAPPEKKRGLRGAIQEKEEDELKQYMQQAAELVHSYVPPDPVKLLASQQAGNVTIQPQPNQGVKVTFANYLKQGDSIAIDVDLVDNRLQNASVSSYIGDSQNDAITLQANWSVLAPSGISYVQSATLNAPAKNLTVTVNNSDYTKVMQ